MTNSADNTPEPNAPDVAQNPPADNTPDPAPPAPVTPPQDTNPIKELQETIAALPESISNAVKETLSGWVPPTPAAPPATPEKKTVSKPPAKPADNPPPEPTAPQRQTFGDWWFGK